MKKNWKLVQKLIFIQKNEWENFYKNFFFQFLVLENFYVWPLMISNDLWCQLHKAYVTSEALVSLHAKNYVNKICYFMMKNVTSNNKNRRFNF